jgi:2-dehydropantoate 2-reductase
VRRLAVLDAGAEHVARMREPGLLYVEGGLERTVRLDAVTSADQLDGRFDVAFVGVKAPWHEAALQPLVDRDVADAYVSLGNGLIQDRLEGIVGRGRLLACLVEWAGNNLGPGRLARDTQGPMVVGELDGAVRERTRLAARCVEAVGEASITDNVRGMIWSKLLLNTAFTGLSAVSGLRYGGVAERPAGRAAAVGIWAEGLRVAAAEGVALEPVLGVAPRDVTADGDGVERLMAVSGNSKPSMLQDLEAGRATEVDVVNGGVAQRGRAHGLPTPLNDRIVELVHAMERGERAPSPACLDELV